MATVLFRGQTSSGEERLQPGCECLVVYRVESSLLNIGKSRGIRRTNVHRVKKIQMVDRIKSFAAVSNERNHQLFLTKLVIFSKVYENKSNSSGVIDQDLPSCQDFEGVKILQVFRNQVFLSQKSEEAYQDRSPDCKIFWIIYINKGIHFL